MSLRQQSQLHEEHKKVQAFYALPMKNHEHIFELNLIQKRFPQKNTDLIQLLRSYILSHSELPSKDIEGLLTQLWQGNEFPKVKGDARIEFLQKYYTRYYHP
jgi:hypothetical protein